MQFNVILKWESKYATARALKCFFGAFFSHMQNEMKQIKRLCYLIKWHGNNNNNGSSITPTCDPWTWYHLNGSRKSHHANALQSQFAFSLPFLSQHIYLRTCCLFVYLSVSSEWFVRFVSPPIVQDRVINPKEPSTLTIVSLLVVLNNKWSELFMSVNSLHLNC